MQRPYLLDMSLEIVKGLKKENNEIGKMYYPLCPMDEKGERVYVLAGYSDQFLHPYILNVATLDIEMIKMEK